MAEKKKESRGEYATGFILWSIGCMALAFGFKYSTNTIELIIWVFVALVCFKTTRNKIIIPVFSPINKRVFSPIRESIKASVQEALEEEAEEKKQKAKKK